MKRLLFPTLLTATLTVSAFAAPSAILTRVSGDVTVTRGAQKLAGKNGLQLQNGDKVIVNGGSATVFSLGGPPRTVKSGSLVVGAGTAKSASPGVWGTVYQGLHNGLNKGDRRVAATMRPGEIVPLSPVRSLIATPRPTFLWQAAPGTQRYEVTVLQGAKVVWRAQTADSKLAYPATSPALSGALTWRVTPLHLVGGAWQLDAGASSPVAFQIATAAQVAAAKADLAAVDAGLKTAPQADRLLARAALWDGRGFHEAALAELVAIQSDPTALDLQHTIWVETGQEWRLPAPALSPEKIGGADAATLAFTPDSLPTAYGTKKYSALDGRFALQIPDSFGVNSFLTKDGAMLYDFAPGEAGGARLTFVYGPAQKFNAKSTLLAHIKSIIDSINAMPANKGNSMVIQDVADGTFRGARAKITEFKSITKGKAALGQAIEWSEAGNEYLFMIGDGSGTLKGAQALRPVLDTLVLGQAVPQPTQPESVSILLGILQASVKQKSAEFDRDAQFVQDYRSADVSAAQALDLDAYEKARLATPENTYERSLAAIKASKRAASLAMEASTNGDSAGSTALFQKSQTLEKESYTALVAALRGAIEADNAQIAKLRSYTPPQMVATTYNTVLQGWKDLNTLRWGQLHFRAQYAFDAKTLDESAKASMNNQREIWSDLQLSNWTPQQQTDLALEIAEAFDGLDTLATQKGDLDAARAYNARDLAWRLSVPAADPNRRLYLALGNRGTLEAGLGDVGLARDYFQRAIAEQDRLESAKRQEIAAQPTPEAQESDLTNWVASRSYYYTALGTVLKRMGNYALGEELYKKSLAVLDELPSTGVTGATRATMRAATLSNISVLRADSGDYTGAAQFIDEAVKLYKDQGSKSGLALSLFNSASLSYQLSHFTEAQAKLDEVRPLFELIGRPADVVDCDVLAAQIAEQTGDNARSLELARKAWQEAHQTGDVTRIGGAASTLAWMLLNTVIEKPLTPEIDTEVTGLIKEMMTADARAGASENEVRTYNLRARFAIIQKKYPEALSLEMAAITRTEAIRGTVASAADFSNVESTRQMYTRAVRLLLILGRKDEAFDMISRSRAQNLKVTFTASAVDATDPAVQAAITSAAVLDEKLGTLRGQLANAQAEPVESRDTQLITALQDQIASTQAQFFEVSAQLKKRNARFDQVLSLAPTELKKAQKSIPDGALLLQYAPLDDGLYIFAVTKNSLEIFAPKVSTKELNATIRAYRDAVATDIDHLGKGEAVESIDDVNSPLRTASAQLSKWLIDPVRRDIDAAKTVAIIPSGELFYLPFHALGRVGLDQKWHFLVEDKPVAYLAKGDVLSIGQQRDLTGGGKGVLALGDPTGAALPAAEQEVESIAKIFPGSNALTGAGASKAVLLLPASRSMRMLHLAAHGVLDSAQPDQSYIQLSPSGNDDGKLRVGDILGIDLNKVDLVTLSACQTALGEGNPDGTEISSLAQSFSTAGTPSVVASLWNVEDQSTAKLMETFYGALANGTPKGMALQKAQVALLKDPKTRHPVFWAPFELLGDWR